MSDDELSEYFRRTRGMDLSKLHNPEGGTITMVPGKDGVVVYGVIKGTATIDIIEHATIEAEFGPKYADHQKREQILEPDKNAPRNEWFAYYDKCKAARKKITHKDIATKIGLSESRIKHDYRDYKKEIALK